MNPTTQNKLSSKNKYTLGILLDYSTYVMSTLSKINYLVGELVVRAWNEEVCFLYNFKFEYVVVNMITIKNLYCC